MVFTSKQALAQENNDCSVELIINITDTENKPIENAAIYLLPFGIGAISNEDGTARLSVQAGRCEIHVSLLGYEKKSMLIVLSSDSPSIHNITLNELSYSLDDVVVVAEQSKTRLSSTTVIGQQAIEHTQATSFKDLLQLLPGRLITSNPSLTNAGYFTNRSDELYDQNNSFGASIVIDGVPLSTNADMNSRGGTYQTDATGVDLRSIGTDNIESVEVIRGIASVEHGDMSSGAVIINTKKGISDLSVKGKIMPGIYQVYAGKGFDVGNNNIINIDIDYARGTSDPRYTTDTYDRYLASATHLASNHAKNITFDTRLSASIIKEWRGPDPSEKIQDVWDKSNDNLFAISHKGHFNLGRLFSKSLDYTASLSYKDSRSHSRAKRRGGTPLITEATNGMHDATLLPSNYYTEGGTIGKPLSLFVKVSNRFALSSSNSINSINIGGEYKLEKNLGEGYFNVDPMLPYSIASNRARALNDIPALSQLSIYLEDNLTWYIMGKERSYPTLKTQAGIRLTAIQLGRPESMLSLSPRINNTLAITEDIAIHFGAGISEKTPSLSMLYPEESYFDYMNANYSNSEANYLGVYTTHRLAHTAYDLRPMRNTKYECGIRVSTDNDMSFTLTGYLERSTREFGSDNSYWQAYRLDQWSADDIRDDDGTLSFDKNNPSGQTTILQNISRSANNKSHIYKGIEFDFDFGQIEATKTSFYLNGAFSQTRYSSLNNTYMKPKGVHSEYSSVYLVYDGSSDNRTSKRLSSSFRAVQSIPQFGFVISATIQCSIYDYKLSRSTLAAPMGYITMDDNTLDGSVADIRFTPFTDAERANPDDVTFMGHELAPNIYDPTAYTDIAEVWPAVWLFNLRASKSITEHIGLSFYVNNLFFNQPWQRSNISITEVERNSSLYSFGFELNVNL